MQNISKEYRTGDLVQKALDDVSLNLRDSEFVAILGPSGSGKTTLLNIIGGLDRYDAGDLIINGISTKEYNDRNWDTYRNHSIGFVFQSYNLIGHQTVLANVELALTIGGLSGKERRERAIRALEEVGLGEQIHKKPNQMSGGQMQRVALARALVNDPDILLADEPTGALDTETSIQVMDLMKEVAKDRLVVMVTHNPELAEEYASRIVRLRDGKIIGDTMPFTDAEIFRESAAEADALPRDGESMVGSVPATDADIIREPAAAESVLLSGAAAQSAGGEAAFTEPSAKKAGRKKHASMSFLTSLALSFSNLRTKKGRTILTSFAGSIGIIGIALILSLSTGVNDYIEKIQRDTMASYPITISATSFDFASVMGSSGPAANFGEDEEAAAKTEEGRVYANYRDMETSSAVTTSIKENNLTDFKKYLDDPKSEIHQYIGENGIVYTYNVDFKVYSYDSDHKLVDTDLDVTAEFTDDSNVLGNLVEARSLMLSNMSSMFGRGTQNAANFSEMMAGANGEKVSALIRDNYDLVYGSWPENYDEVVLVLNGNGSIFSGKLYQLGLITKKQYGDAVRKIEKKEEPEEFSLSYQDICDHEFYLLTACDQYRKNADGTFSTIIEDKDSLEKAMPQALKLKISGLVKASEDADISSLETTIGYTTDLTNYLVEHGNKSEVVTAQKNSPHVDVLTGQAFVEDEPDDATKAAKGRQYIEGRSHDEKADLLSAVMMVDYEGGTQALMTTQMSAFGEQIGAAIQTSIGSAMEQAIGAFMEQAVGGMMQQILRQMELAQAQAQQVYAEMMQKVVAEAMQQMLRKMTEQITGIMMEQLQTKIFPQIMEQSVLQSVKKIVASMREQLGDLFPASLGPLENVTNLEQLQAELAKLDPADFVGIDLSSLDFSGIDFSDIDYSKIDFSGLDFSGIDISSMDFGDVDLSNVDMSGLDMSGIDLGSVDMSGMDFGNVDFSGVDFGNMDFSGLSFSEEGGDMAETVQYWLDHIATQKSLIGIYDRYIGTSNYDSNLKKFGYISYDTPSTISLYADTFEGKDGITASLKHYNDKSSEENKITYTDYVALITSSITTIINAISYVLIGFVAVSLFVSCIMIGIITNISVLERTKEIGVLRALGASKRNISNVFNAETFIVGCFSGIIGIGVSLLLTLPINAIVHALMDSNVLSAKLPPVSAGILILISIVITIIGGLIPASKAAKQDPVIALRSE